MNQSSNERKRSLATCEDENGVDISLAGAAANVASASIASTSVASPSVAAANIASANIAAANVAAANVAMASVAATPPMMTMHTPYFYPGAIIPPFPFTTPMYPQPMSYTPMMPYCDYGYGNRRFVKKKKNYHHYSRQENSGMSILKEALVDPWAQQYAKYPNIIFD
ncbi:hypothetical protein AK88_01038 [Plasmodium fragile]|uniref:Uncharacterized protein n=1 Tax=Plasmodium fragile TaxID=5857 RepID=A0A0D9QRE9_PLAFR|nr:uncharacterized protein AK88_01038 [Plasmodium fragile]KJP89372.1 hypothetical protein AK88_01038 [Plasmodium fragile]